jgi:predicted transcriptional regulator
MTAHRNEKKPPLGLTDDTFHLPHHVQIGDDLAMFESIQRAFDQAERGEAIEPRSVIYVAPETMRDVLVESRSRIMEYVSLVREVHSIEAMAQELNRERSGVSRDVKLLEKLGLLKVQECVHSGHGKRKSISLAHDHMEIRLRFA